MSVGHRHHYHGRGGLSQPQGGRPTSAPSFIGVVGNSCSGGVHSYQTYPVHPYQHHHNAPRHRRGGGGHLPLNEVAAPEHAHDAMGGSADGGGSGAPIPITGPPPPSSIVDPSLQSVAPASTVAVASAGSSSPHGGHQHHHHHYLRSHHPHATHRANFPFGGPRPAALGGSGLAQEGGQVSPLTSPTVSSRSSSASSSASSSPFSASGIRAHFGGRRGSGDGKDDDGNGEGQQQYAQQRGLRMWRLEVGACVVCMFRDLLIINNLF